MPAVHTASLKHMLLAGNSAQRLLLAGTVLVLATLALPAAGSAQNSERITFSGRNIAVYNLVGQLRVTGGASAAVATVTRRGRDGARLTLGTGAVGTFEALRIGYPSDRITIPEIRGRRMRTEMRVREDGTFGSEYGSGRGANRYNNGRRVRISDEGGGLEAAADIELQIPNGVTVRLHVAFGEVTVTSVRGDIAVDVSGGNVHTTDTQGTLTIDTGSGDATVTNASGMLSLDTGSGDVIARNVSGDGLLIDSGSGSVTLEGCSSNKVSIDTGSGNLRVADMTTRSLSMDTGSGDVVLGLRNSPDMITIDSGSGDVTLNLPANFSATLDIDSGSGGITSDFPMQVSSKSRDKMTGRIGNGDGRISIETGSGSVRLRKVN
jgi:lia operon protein LiaG